MDSEAKKVPATEVPLPIKQTEAEIAQTIATQYTPFPATWVGDVNSLRKGDPVFWKGFKRSKNGGYSGKAEYFNCIFHGFGVAGNHVIVN